MPQEPPPWFELPLDEMHALIAATPWQKREWMIPHRVMLPVSWWGRAIYWALLPFAVLLWLAQWIVLPS